MEIFRSKKALSPVVASIILIAVTVAVSIAVAAWMGALTFTFMKTETYNIVSMSFTGASNATNNAIVLRIQNTGTSSFTVDTAGKVNGVTKTLAAQVTVAAGATSDITIPNVQWINGRQYNVELITTQGTKITYTAVGPQT
jgi:flagellin-like protein